MKKLSFVILLTLSTIQLYSQVLFVDYYRGYTPKRFMKYHKFLKKELYRATKINLTFPFYTVWLQDTVFIDNAEIPLREWAYYVDDTLSQPISMDLLETFNYNIEPVYNSKDKGKFFELINNSPLLSEYGQRQKFNIPMVFVTPDDIRGYADYLHIDNHEWDSLIKRKGNVIRHYFVENFELLTLDDYLFALKKYENISPSVRITDCIPDDIPVPIAHYNNCPKGARIIGLRNNASEIVLYNEEPYVVYKVTDTEIFISKFRKPDYHIGFRLKCRLTKRQP